MAKNLKEIYQYLLSTIIVVAVFILFYVLMTKPIPEPNKDIIQIGIGIVFGALTSVISYFFGSSMGSKAKTDLINNKPD